MDETPLIQQYVQLRSQFMSYLYAIARDAELAEEIYQNAAIVVIEQAARQETIHNFRAWAKEVVRRQALHAIRARQVSTQHSRAMSPELLDAVSDVFLQEESEDSLVRDEAATHRQHTFATISSAPTVLTLALVRRPTTLDTAPMTALRTRPDCNVRNPKALVTSTLI